MISLLVPKVTYDDEASEDVDLETTEVFRDSPKLRERIIDIEAEQKLRRKLESEAEQRRTTLEKSPMDVKQYAAVLRRQVLGNVLQRARFEAVDIPPGGSDPGGDALLRNEASKEAVPKKLTLREEELEEEKRRREEDSITTFLKPSPGESSKQAVFAPGAGDMDYFSTRKAHAKTRQERLETLGLDEATQAIVGEFSRAVIVDAVSSAQRRELQAMTRSDTGSKNPLSLFEELQEMEREEVVVYGQGGDVEGELHIISLSAPSTCWDAPFGSLLLMFSSHMIASAGAHIVHTHYCTTVV